MPASDKSRSILFHCLGIAAIIFMLLIPLGYVQDIVFERSSLFNEATSDIAASWGGRQTVSGPVLILPYSVWEDVVRVQVSHVDGKEYTQDVT